MAFVLVPNLRSVISPLFCRRRQQPLLSSSSFVHSSMTMMLLNPRFRILGTFVRSGSKIEFHHI
ncbi:hypothetical protein SESBI_27302 [Sesbania bispinosa]|nr:hypothetical protein SESBI_27302 [Sesbania bispinosa]